MKKTLISLIVVLALVVVGFFSWYFFVRDKDVPPSEVVSGVSPFGSGEGVLGQQPNPSVLTGEDGQPIILDEFGSPSAPLFRISDTPVAGFVVLNNSSSSAFVRYVDRSNGHIYDVDLAVGEKVKVANQTLPKVYEAYFRPDGEAVLVRTLKDDTDVVENLSLTLTPPKTSGDLYTTSSTALRGNIGSIVVGSNTTLFYVLRDTTSIVSSVFGGGNYKTLYSSPFINWRLSVAGSGLIIYTKASARVGGYAYFLRKGVLKKILGPLFGLVVVPNISGNQLLYSFVENGKTRLFVKNLTNNTIYEISSATLAEKCVWGKKNASIVFCGSPSSEIGVNEPDAWYQGLTSFSDRIWSFDTNTETAKVLVEPASVLDIDLIRPVLSPNEDYLVFINKRDLSLWALKLEQP